MNAEPTGGGYCRACAARLFANADKAEKAAYRRFLDVGNVPTLAGDWWCLS